MDLLWGVKMQPFRVIFIFGEAQLQARDSGESHKHETVLKVSSPDAGQMFALCAKVHDEFAECTVSKRDIQM